MLSLYIMKEYIIHGTTLENLENILIDEYIRKDTKIKTNIDININQIFTQLIYYDIPKQSGQYPHYFNCCIVLNINILRDYPFYANIVGSFNNNFKDGIKSDDKIIKKSGKLKKVPNLKKLKDHINDYMINNYNNLKMLTFIHSNEILFNKKISLKKYCVCIIIRINKYSDKKVLYKLKLLCDKLMIDLKFNDKNGLNQFIDLIEQ